MPPSDLWVICLCAEWCELCKNYRVLFQDMARRHPHLRFAWVDIEDEAALVGEMDIETFPTLLVADSRGGRFYGTLLPHASMLDRLLTVLSAPDAPIFELDTSAQALLAALPRMAGLWVDRQTIV